MSNFYKNIYLNIFDLNENENNPINFPTSSYMYDFDNIIDIKDYQEDKYFLKKNVFLLMKVMNKNILIMILI